MNMKIPETILDDDVLLKAFIVSSFTGIAAIAAPVIMPVALTGMAVSQGLFWSKRLVDKDKSE